MTNGNITNAVGKPILNQVKKSISKAETAIPFGGDPTAVPFPPILAEYAVPRMIIVRILGYSLFTKAIAIGIIIAVVAVLLIHIDKKLVTAKNPTMETHSLPLDIDVTLSANHLSIPCLFKRAAKVNPPINKNMIVLEKGAIASFGVNMPMK